MTPTEGAISGPSRVPKVGQWSPAVCSARICVPVDDEKGVLPEIAQRPGHRRRCRTPYAAAPRPCGIILGEPWSAMRRPMNSAHAHHPSGVSYQAMHPATKQGVTIRLRRIEGQVGGLQRMVEDGRYCLDILTQINAVRAALHKVEAEILRDHVSHCVAHAFTSGDRIAQRHKIEELVEPIGRMRKR